MQSVSYMRVGLTGGIGSGKSLVASFFELLGVPVFRADDEAIYLMEHDPALQSEIIRVFGEKVYEKGRLNRPFLASLVFGNEKQLEILNSIVHPAVIAYGRQWALTQTAPYTIKEAAIFFESGSNKEMDRMIGVYAPESVRIERVMRRDGISDAEVRDRISKQMDDAEKMKRCDYVIQNDGSASVIEQVLSLHERLLSQCR